MATPILNDRKLAADVRRLALTEIQSILNGKSKKKYSKEFTNQLLLKLAGSVLPRLNEHTGADGAALVLNFDPTFHATTPETERDSAEPSKV